MRRSPKGADRMSCACVKCTHHPKHATAADTDVSKGVRKVSYLPHFLQKHKMNEKYFNEKDYKFSFPYVPTLLSKTRLWEPGANPVPRHWQTRTKPAGTVNSTETGTGE